MNDIKRIARNWLIHSTKTEFYSVLNEAKITPRQIKICEMRFVKGLLNYQIAMELDVSVKTVEKDLAFIYNSLSKVLK